MNSIDTNQTRWRVKELNRMARANVLSDEDLAWLQGQRLSHKRLAFLTTHQLIAALQRTESLKRISARLTT